MSQATRILVIQHDVYPSDRSSNYQVNGLIPFWEQMGHEVISVSGSKYAPPADIAFLHVDLSEVPRRFIKLAQRYPVTINAGITDIRKSAIHGTHRHSVSLKHWDGPVIVKTDYNSNAQPESRAHRRAKSSKMLFMERIALARICRHSNPKIPYAVIDHKSLIPKETLDNPYLFAEPFIPEMDGENYVLRNAYFFGDQYECWKLTSPNPIVRWKDCVGEEICEIPEEVLEFRDKTRLDYGKIDFVIHEGKAHVIDINKTIGGPIEHQMNASFATGIERYAKLAKTITQNA